VSFETALRVMLPVVDALCAVHAESILHRDISPDNIYLTRNGKVKLIDFGAARNALSQKSRNLSIILKEGYAPEEQYRASGIQGPWTDVYATAATMYHAVTGQVPQPALDRQPKTNFKRRAIWGSRSNRVAEAALMKALNIRAADRFPSMEDFKSALTGNIDVAGATKQIDRNDPRIQALERAAQAEAAARSTGCAAPGHRPHGFRSATSRLPWVRPRRIGYNLPCLPRHLCRRLRRIPYAAVSLTPPPVASVTPARQKWLWPAILARSQWSRSPRWC
jgi:serine/threonine protein kinase